MTLDNLEHQAYGLMGERKLYECIDLFENALNEIPPTPYHLVLGRNMLLQTEEAANYIQKFYESALESINLQAIYIEMNELAINPSLWFMDAFGYKNYPGLSNDWLCDWDTPDFDLFTIKGFEDIQQVFKDVYLDQSQPKHVEDAGRIAEYLVTLRMQELIHQAHMKANESISDLKNIVVLSTSHGFDFIHESVL